MARHSRKVVVYDRDMQKIDEYESAEAAAKGIGVEPISIRNACRRGNISRYPSNKYGGRYYLAYGEAVTQYVAEVDVIQSQRFIESYNDIAERLCLGCGIMFISTGPWHRRCKSCRGREDNDVRYYDRTHRISTGRHVYME